MYYTCYYIPNLFLLHLFVTNKLYYKTKDCIVVASNRGVFWKIIQNRLNFHAWPRRNYDLLYVNKIFSLLNGKK